MFCRIPILLIYFSEKKSYRHIYKCKYMYDVFWLLIKLLLLSVFRTFADCSLSLLYNYAQTVLVMRVIVY